jgi:hypothetical protein
VSAVLQIFLDSTRLRRPRGRLPGRPSLPERNLPDGRMRVRPPSVAWQRWLGRVLAPMRRRRPRRHLAARHDGCWRIVTRNASGIGKIGQGVAYLRGSLRTLGRSVARRPPPLARALPAWWRRRHGFPRSHGPAEEKTKRRWLYPKCQSNPRPAEIWPIPGWPHELTHIRLVAARAKEPARQNAEQTQHPQKSWRVRERTPAAGFAADCLVCWQPVPRNPIVRALKPEETP